MSTRNLHNNDQPQEPATTDARDHSSSSVATASLRGPYLKIFSSCDGCFEYDLTTSRTTIGRSDESDIKLDDAAVSRKHAVIVRANDEFLLKDLSSYEGTKVNGRSIQRYSLQHGDSIQISAYVLQFTSHTIDNVAPRVTAKAKRLLRGDFHLLPSSMELKYRFLQSDSGNIFASGDTLVVGRGGLLVPAQSPPEDAAFLELSLTWPDRREKRLLGEILGVIPDESINWICVKLHRGSKEIHERFRKSGAPTDWIPVFV